MNTDRLSKTSMLAKNRLSLSLPHFQRNKIKQKRKINQDERTKMSHKIKSLIAK